MNLTASTIICMSIGDPIAHSKGPSLYNRVYEKLGIDGEFVYVSCRVKLDDIGDFIRGVRAMNIRGIGCTLPHKVEVMQYLDVIDPLAIKIGAVNTIVNDDGVLTGYNTDILGAVTPLERLTPLGGKKVALLGAGGAARAFAFGLTDKGAKVTIFNRTSDKAEALAKDSGASTGSWDNLSDVKDADIIVNSTSVGMQPNSEETPLGSDYFREGQIVMDAVYTPEETRFLREAKQAGARIVYGTEMYLQQGIAQFKFYTGQELPEDLMRETLQEVNQSKAKDGAA